MAWEHRRKAWLPRGATQTSSLSSTQHRFKGETLQVSQTSTLSIRRDILYGAICMPLTPSGTSTGAAGGEGSSLAPPSTITRPGPAGSDAPISEGRTSSNPIERAASERARAQVAQEKVNAARGIKKPYVPKISPEAAYEMLETLRKEQNEELKQVGEEGSRRPSWYLAGVDRSHV